MFCTLVDSNIRLHSGQNAVDSQIIAKWVRNKFPTTVTECNITANCGIKKKILMLFFALFIRDTPGNDLFRTMTAAYVQEDVQVKEIKKKKPVDINNVLLRTSV